MSEFTIMYRVQNMYHTMPSLRSLYKLMSAYLDIRLFGQKSNMEYFGKIFIDFTCFYKTLDLRF